MVGNVGPSAIRRCQLCLECSVESDDPRVTFGIDPDPIAQPPLELSNPKSRIRRRFADAKRPTLAKNLIGSPGDCIWPRLAGDMIEQEPGGYVNAITEIAHLPQFLLELGKDGAKDGASFTSPIGQFRHWDAEELMKS
jgi:hypothetical protein